MSAFLAETAIRRLAIVPRVLATSATPRAAFSTSHYLNKTVTETAKDTLKTVDRAVSDKLVDGINISANVANKVKEAGDDIVNSNASGKAAELRNEAAGKASELSGKAAELSGQAKGKAAELAGQAKGKTHEVAGKAQGQAEKAQRQL